MTRANQEVRHFVWSVKDGPANCAVCDGPILHGDPVARKGRRARHEWCKFPDYIGGLEDAMIAGTVTPIVKPLLLDSGLILFQGRLYDPAEIQKSMPWLSVQETMEYA